jgi:hypothetical protein
MTESEMVNNLTNALADVITEAIENDPSVVAAISAFGRLSARVASIEFNVEVIGKDNSVPVATDADAEFLSTLRIVPDLTISEKGM